MKLKDAGGGERVSIPVHLGSKYGFIERKEANSERILDAVLSCKEMESRASEALRQSSDLPIVDDARQLIAKRSKNSGCDPGTVLYDYFLKKRALSGEQHSAEELITEHSIAELIAEAWWVGTNSERMPVDEALSFMTVGNSTYVVDTDFNASSAIWELVDSMESFRSLVARNPFIGSIIVSDQSLKEIVDERESLIVGPKLAELPQLRQ